MNFSHHNHKPDNHVKQSIKYTNFRKAALTIFKNLETTSFSWKLPPQNKKSIFDATPPKFARKPTKWKENNWECNRGHVLP